MDYDENIFRKVRSIIADSLMISPEEVNMDSALEDELGATSLDFVDIQFRLEKEFKIKLYQGNIIDKFSEVFGQDTLSNNGRLTEFGAEVVRRRMPEIRPAKIVAGLPLANVPSLFTTATWVRVVQELHAARLHDQEHALTKWAETVAADHLPSNLLKGEVKPST